MEYTSAKERVFAMLDADGDGVISASEYLARARNVIRATGRADDDPLVIAARASGERAWAAMDADGDGGVTFEEYDAWAGAEAFDGVCRATLAALFDLADGDGDGRLTRSEFLLLRTALGNPEANARAAFDELDADGDGLVGRDEYLASIRAHVAEEGSAMGKALYG
ncbi:EF-hand domain-containing protein [Streptomyces sp. URMC 126]|uniref:EF-hand domain-containing protein n=1 Tax=Streptomyces sp. URMC 126 TaxID=3423401 RepID=UPI003F1A8CCE